MKISFRNYEKEDVLLLKDMWNEVIEDGMSFPQIEPYDTESFSKVLEEETAVVCMCVDGEIAGYYTLHPNIIGRCSHVANISYLIGKNFAEGIWAGIWWRIRCAGPDRKDFEGSSSTASAHGIRRLSTCIRTQALRLWPQYPADSA